MAEFPAIQRKIDEAVVAAVEPMRDELTRLREEVEQMRSDIRWLADNSVRAATAIALVIPSMAPPAQAPMAGIARELMLPLTVARA